MDNNIASCYSLRYILCFSLSMLLICIMYTMSCYVVDGTLRVSQAHAIVVPRPLSKESRIKIVHYMPNTVVKYVGHYTYQSIIEFEDDEAIETVTMGIPSGWKLDIVGNRIFVKPVGDNATTNMTVISNKRMYFFEMHAEYADSVEDQSITFVTKFLYQKNVVDLTGGVTNLGAVSTVGINAAPDLTNPANFNFNYRISGKLSIIDPILIFDDGQFTYFKFRNVNADMPAVFMVDRNGNEALVNYRIAHGYLVVERVTDKFTLRHGPDVLCVFNQGYNAVIGDDMLRAKEVGMQAQVVHAKQTQ